VVRISTASNCDQSIAVSFQVQDAGWMPRRCSDAARCASSGWIDGRSAQVAKAIRQATGWSDMAQTHFPGLPDGCHENHMDVGKDLLHRCKHEGGKVPAG